MKGLSRKFTERPRLSRKFTERPIPDVRRVFAWIRNHRYEKPLSFMRRYLDAMDGAPFMAAPPTSPPSRVIGALHPKMLALAAERAAGAHPYFVPPEHTARAREIMGRGPLLAPEQALVLERDAATARAIARGHMAMYLGLPNYVRNLRSLGFGDDDLTGGGSDRLVDAIVAWGDVDALRGRVRAHHAAGADHVCVQVLSANPRALPMAEWRELAPALLAS
jgi:probable F420-dependent oxidoreductase